MNNNVITILQGRLGNNLFEIANGYSYSKKINANFYYLILDKKWTPNEYQMIKNNFTYYSNKQNNYQDILINENSNQEFIDLENIFIYDKNIFFNGFFQSEKYFNEKLIKNIFKISDEKRNYLFKKYGNVNDYLGISIRYWDSLTPRGSLNILGIDYFNDMYNKFFKGKKCIITTNNKKFVEENIKIKDYIIPDENEENQLYLLSLCKDHILSNSTFSWWGSWLNEQKNSINITTPKWNVNSQNKFLIPDRWIKIDDYEKYLI